MHTKLSAKQRLLLGNSILPASNNPVNLVDKYSSHNLNLNKVNSNGIYDTNNNNNNYNSEVNGTNNLKNNSLNN